MFKRRYVVYKLSESSAGASDSYSIIHSTAENNIKCACFLENMYVITKTKQTGLLKFLRPNNCTLHGLK
jgi:hypothetical protein